jgi:hypothetical protein
MGHGSWPLYVLLQGQEFFIGGHLQGNVIRSLTTDSLVMPIKAIVQKDGGICAKPSTLQEWLL